MSEVMKMFFSLSISGSIIALIIFIIKPISNNRFSKTWQYYIWLIVIIRLLLPFSFEINIVNQLFMKIDSIQSSQETDEITSIQSKMVEHISSLPYTANNFISQIAQTSNIETVSQDENTKYIDELISNIWFLWLGITIMLLVRKITSYHSFVRYIKAGVNEVTDSEVLEIYKSVLAEAGLKKPLNIYSNKLVTSPMLVGTLYPFIVIPDIEVGKKELINIFMHELTHYKRLDIFYKWLTQFAVCIHWYNPLVYLISREINKNCELSCDETIIKKLDYNGKRSYGDTLLSSLKFNGNYGNTIISITLNEDARLLKERLGAIMKFKKKSKLAITFTAIMTIIILFSATVTGAYAATNKVRFSNITNESGEIFRIIYNFTSEDSDQFSYSTFTIDSDITIRVSAKMSAKSGQLEFFIQPKPINAGGYISSNGGVHDKYGNTIKTVYDISGNNIEEVKILSLKAGEYLAGFRGTGKLRTVSYDIRGAIVTNNIVTENRPDNDANPIINDESTTQKTQKKSFQFPSMSADIIDSLDMSNLNHVDQAAITLLWYSGSWDIVELLIPNMTKHGIDNLAAIYNQKNQYSNIRAKNPSDYYNITGAAGADSRALTMTQKNGTWMYIEPLFPYMSNKGIDEVIALFNQKHRHDAKKVASDFYNYQPISNAKAAIDLSSKNTFNIAESGSFQVDSNNQILTLDITSSIKGGTVDLFLFDPNGKEQRITISASNMKKEIKLTKGTWQYNCSGAFKDGGNIRIVGTISG